MSDTGTTGEPVVGDTTTVANEVVEKIAVAAARSVPGVADLGGDVARFFNTMLDKVGLDSVGDGSRGVAARVEGADVTVDVVLVLEAGRVVAEVTAEVQTKVTEALTGYGLNVLAVHVKVDDISGV
ncbi:MULTISPECIES: Asp23/Gls24 family envelope stress response protein [Actinoplanes]|uniref:Asp23/Gls24 family envelope stress response protein n=1 Tax=Actinoplanes TaxID=1865 RepID=UPI0005F293AA|nr:MULTISPECIES: Asp23/Gls24 family envelope stress response protein [Actinoplanes]